MLFDTHCHIQFNAYQEDADAVVQRAVQNDVRMIAVGSQSSTSRRAVAYAEKYPAHVFAAVGLHPAHLISQQIDEEEFSFKTREESFDHEFYKNLALNPRVVGIGETGFEFYHLPAGLSLAEARRKQEEVFLSQAELADELNLPLILHCRQGHDVLLPLLKNLISQGKLKNRGVAHCFSGSWEEARQYLDLDFYLGFTGVICFPVKKNDPQAGLALLETVKKTPLDKILLETDAPYLAPPPHRGERNEPAYVSYVAEKMAELKNIDFEETAEQTCQNALRLFKKIAA